MIDVLTLFRGTGSDCEKAVGTGQLREEEEIASQQVSFSSSFQCYIYTHWIGKTFSASSFHIPFACVSMSAVVYHYHLHKRLVASQLSNCFFLR